MTDRTSAIAEGIANDASLTTKLLDSCCLPVADEEEGIGGRRQYRLLVVGGALVAAARFDDGIVTPNVGGVAADVTDLVHPATAAAACLAARIVGLDIAGVDVVADDVSRPLAGQGGVIAGVHAGPGLITHLEPAAGEPRPVGRALVDHLFPDNETGRIPVVGISGSSGTTAVARLVAELLRLGGKYTGVACGDGLFLDSRPVEKGNRADWQSGRRILMNRSVAAAVIENGADVILSEGLAYDRCQVGVITGIDPGRHFGPHFIDTPEQVFRVFRTQIDVVLPGGAGVIAATDPMAAQLAELCDGEVIYYGVDPALPLVAEHRARGGRAVCVSGGEVILTTGAVEIPLLPLAKAPLLGGRDASERLPGLLAAVAVGWVLGLALHVIRTGVETFVPDPGEPAEQGAAVLTDSVPNANHA